MITQNALMITRWYFKLFYKKRIFAT